MLHQKMGQTSVAKRLVRFCLSLVAVLLQAVPYALFWFVLLLDVWSAYDCEWMFQKFTSLPAGTPASALVYALRHLLLFYRRGRAA